MFENIKKEEWLRWGVIAIFVIFITSTIATYMSAGGRMAGPGVGGAGGAASNTSLDTFDGQGSATVTLLAWDPALRVVGFHPDLPALLDQWRAEGRVVMVQNMSEGQRIVRLSSGNEVYNLSRRLGELNLSVLADGTILIPWAQMQGPGISLNATGDNFPFHSSPQYEVGDSFPVLFSGRVVGGKLMSYGQMYFAPVPVVDAEVAPTNVSLVRRFYNVVFPWENRDVQEGALSNNLLGGSRTVYTPQSSIRFEPELTEAQIAALAQKLPPYAGGILQPGMMSVQPNMTDRARVVADLAALGIPEPKFPTSLMEVYPWEGNLSDDELLEYMQKTLNKSYPQANYTILGGYRLRVQMPPKITGEGQEYEVLNRTIELRSIFRPMENGTLKVSFFPSGRRVLNYTYAQYSPRGIVVGG